MCEHHDNTGGICWNEEVCLNLTAGKRMPATAVMAVLLCTSSACWNLESSKGMFSAYAATESQSSVQHALKEPRLSGTLCAHHLRICGSDPSERGSNLQVTTAMSVGMDHRMCAFLVQLLAGHHKHRRWAGQGIAHGWGPIGLTAHPKSPGREPSRCGGAAFPGNQTGLSVMSAAIMVTFLSTCRDNGESLW